MGLCGVCRPDSKTKSFTDHNVDRLKSYHASQSKSYVNFKIANALTMSRFIDRPDSSTCISNGGYLLSNSNIPGSSTGNATRKSRVDVTRQILRNVKRDKKSLNLFMLMVCAKPFLILAHHLYLFLPTTLV